MSWLPALSVVEVLVVGCLLLVVYYLLFVQSSVDSKFGVASVGDDLDICPKFFPYLSIVSASGNWTIIPQLCNAQK